jgi:DNA invertase Pin-like site-specific DNA recombinase
MTTPDDQRITPKHRARSAIVYVRQSSPSQVKDYTESTQVQLGLRKLAIDLGWTDPIVINDDLGISASGFAERPGFQRMLTEITMRNVGIILAVNACRLSRNSKDWAHLFELCGYFGTLVADLDQIYDLAVPNDRLVLGIKGTIAEMELSVLRSRLKTGAESKAARGELKFIVPPGFSHNHDGKIILDPDARVRAAIENMFCQFERCASIRQLSIWYRDTKTLFPVRKVRKSRTIEWEIPTTSNLYKLLTHPIYSGAYVYGRRSVQVEYVDGRLVKRVGSIKSPDQCRVFIPDHHPGYITWEKYLANQAKLAEARPRWDMQQNHGAVRDGLALLAGILRCGHCGRKIYVSYKKRSALYFCDGGAAKSTRRCLAFGSHLIDQRIGHELCRALQPLSLEASSLALERRVAEQEQAIMQANLRVQAAQYEADRAFEQYDLVDPKNRLVAESLEQRLNERLELLREAELTLETCRSQIKPLTTHQRLQIEQLGRDFTTVWNHPKAPIGMRKQLLRAAVEEIIVKHDRDNEKLNVVIHWKGGSHTQINVKKRATPVGSKAGEDLIVLVRKLSDSLNDAEIARILNMKKKTTPRGLFWTQDRVNNFRKAHKIRPIKRSVDPNLLSGQNAAKYLGISRNGLYGLIRIGLVRKHQVTDFAPWHISRDELDSEPVQAAVRILKATGRLPKQGGCPKVQQSLFPMISGKVEKEAL